MTRAIVPEPAPVSSEPSKRIGFAAPLLLVALVLFAWHVSLYDTFADDAYITFRYSRNLARGIGPVWNAGEKVEGYSNASWMFLLAATYGLVRESLPHAARVLSAACAAGALALGFALTRKLTRSLFWATIAALGIASSSAFAAHARNGLESAAFALLVLLVAWSLTTTSWRLIAFALVAVSTCRFEGAIVAVVASIAVLVSAMRTPLGRSFLRASIVAGVVYVVFNVWRVAYYRHLLPNSVVAKEGRDPVLRFTEGVLYVRGFFDADLVVLAAVLVGAVGVVIHLGRSRAKPFEPALLFLFAISVVYTAFVVWIGGCWMPAWRMMAHVTPALVVFGVVSFARCPAQLTSIPVVQTIGRAALALLCLFGVQRQIRTVSPTNENLVPRITLWRDQVLELAEMGKWLHRALPRDARVATYASGALPYYARVPCLDVLGLTDAHIAHEGHKNPKAMAGHISSDWPYVLSRKPAIYVATGGGGFSIAPVMRSEPQFQPGYEAALFEFKNIDSPRGRFVTLMIRTERRAELLTALMSDPSVVFVR